MVGFDRPRPFMVGLGRPWALLQGVFWKRALGMEGLGFRMCETCVRGASDGGFKVANVRKVYEGCIQMKGRSFRAPDGPLKIVISYE